MWVALIACDAPSDMKNHTPHTSNVVRHYWKLNTIRTRSSRAIKGRLIHMGNAVVKNESVHVEASPDASSCHAARLGGKTKGCLLWHPH